MKIAVLGSKSLPAFAGADRVAENIVRHLPADDGNRCHVYVVRTPAQPRAFDYAPNVRVIPIPALAGKHSKATTYFFLSALHCALFLRPDLVHAHDSAFGPFAWILRILRPRMPVLGTFHGNPYERAKWSRFAKAFLRFSEAAFVRGCHALTTVARAKVAEVQARAKTPIEFIPNGVEPDPAIARTGLAEKHGLVPGQYLMFAAGRMDPTKGLHHLLDAVAALRLEVPLLVVGGFEGHNQDYSEKLLARCRANPRLVLIPRLLAQPELFELVAGAKLFVFPSEIEAMSMMLLEVISCGVPVLASDIAENVEVVGADYPWLFRNADAAHLAEKLAQFLRAGPGPEIAALRERCARDFNWTAIGARYLALYRRLAGA
ncbi:MAG: glycosyltransferase [Spartobacteria bacterium]|nr:glycosyltransferase [Spartobacteria bacterium]